MKRLREKDLENGENWSAHRLTRNTINVLLDTAHKNYCANLFTKSFQNNKEQLWSYIKRIRKDHSVVSFLIIKLMVKQTVVQRTKLEY